MKKTKQTKLSQRRSLIEMCHKIRMYYNIIAILHDYIIRFSQQKFIKYLYHIGSACVYMNFASDTIYKFHTYTIRFFSFTRFFFSHYICTYQSLPGKKKNEKTKKTKLKRDAKKDRFSFDGKIEYVRRSSNRISFRRTGKKR